MGPFAGQTFLVVENNAHMRRMLCAVLDAFGAGRVLEAGDALTGYLLACSESIDAVLLDFFLGERDGGEFVRLLRHDEASPSRSAPVVVVTALPHHPRVAAALKDGADAVVAKPIVPREFYGALMSAMTAHADAGGGLATSAIPVRPHPTREPQHAPS